MYICIIQYSFSILIFLKYYCNTFILFCTKSSKSRCILYLQYISFHIGQFSRTQQTHMTNGYVLAQLWGTVSFLCISNSDALILPTILFCIKLVLFKTFISKEFNRAHIKHTVPWTSCQTCWIRFSWKLLLGKKKKFWGWNPGPLACHRATSRALDQYS